MIFLTGVHGVGKTTLLSRISKLHPIEIVTASDLIKNAHGDVSNTKLVSDVDDNQKLLAEAVSAFRDERGDRFILDGHCVLINDRGNYELLPIAVFADLAPSQIIVLTDDARRICDRLRARDGHAPKESTIHQLQTIELFWSGEIAHMLGIQCNTVSQPVANSKLADLLTIGQTNGRTF